MWPLFFLLQLPPHRPPINGIWVGGFVELFSIVLFVDPLRVFLCVAFKVKCTLFVCSLKTNRHPTFSWNKCSNSGRFPLGQIWTWIHQSESSKKIKRKEKKRWKKLWCVRNTLTKRLQNLCLKQICILMKERLRMWEALANILVYELSVSRSSS